MRIRVIDAFTDRPFAGNPAAVCLLDGDSWPDEGWMHQVAAEMRHSETAFARKLTDDPLADYALRWFTPAIEVNLCGHATLATAHALHADRGTPATVRFSSRSGILTAESRADGSITLDFPAATLSETPVPDGLAEALGGKAEAVYHTGSLRDLLAVFPDQRAISDLAPNFAALSHVIRRSDARGSSAPPRPRIRRPATTSSPGSSPRSRGSTRTRSPAARTPRSLPIGPNGSAATDSPACRPRRAPVSSKPRCTAIACT